jgi:hypothetical protein
MIFLPYSLMEDLIDLDKAKVKYIDKPQVCPRLNQRTYLASSHWLSLPAVSFLSQLFSER